MIQINSQGFRTHEFAVPKPAGLVRVVCIGGSTTVAGRTNEETYPRLVEAKLRRPPAAGLPVEVLNPGVSGVSHEHWLDRLDRVFAYDPDVVVHLRGDQRSRLAPVPPLRPGAPLVARGVREPALLAARSSSPSTRSSPTSPTRSTHSAGSPPPAASAAPRTWRRPSCGARSPQAQPRDEEPPRREHGVLGPALLRSSPRTRPTRRSSDATTSASSSSSTTSTSPTCSCTSGSAIPRSSSTSATSPRRDRELAAGLPPRRGRARDADGGLSQLARASARASGQTH